MECLALSQEKNRIMRIGILSVSLPWLFGPYAQQMTILADGLLARNHTIYWISLPNAVPPELAGQNLTYQELIDVCELPSSPSPGSKAEYVSSRITFLSLSAAQPGIFPMSAINRILRSHRINAIVSLMDLDKIVPDEPKWAARQSIAWYPNHFASLDDDFRNKLERFTDVASLSPSDTSMLSASLARTTRVTWVPHAIPLVEDADAAAAGMELGSCGVANAAREARRAKWNVPVGAIVVLVNCANYESINRKNLDVSLVAFQQLLEREPRAFLYLHAIDVIEVLKGERKHTEGTLDSMAGQAPGIRLDIVLAELGLPAGSYVLDTKIHSYDASLELTCLADVLLHPSKAEGFGMPLLEAQALGVPVITTRFGAMADYTRYGFSVASQPVWMVRGFARLPLLSEVVDGLLAVARGELPARNRTEASAWVAETMAPSVVVGKLDRLLSSLVGLPGLAPEDEEFDDDGDDAGDAPPFAYDELTYEGGAREAIKLLGSSKGREWILIRSAMYKVKWDPVLANIMEGARKAAPALVNIVILQTQRADGSVFPRTSDLSAGRIDQQLTYFVRRAHARAHLERTIAERSSGGAARGQPAGAQAFLVGATLKILSDKHAAIKLNEGGVAAGPVGALFNRAPTLSGSVSSAPRHDEV